MKLLFAGTSSFAVSSLIALTESSHSIVAVVTRPDRPTGRGRRAAPSRVRVAAEQRGLPVRTPVDINASEEVEALSALAPDLMVVAAYGRILRRKILTLPRLGCVNVHGSLLPAWRGAAPVAHALLAGDAATGVTLMQMDEGLDTGPVLASVETPIEAGENRGELMQRLAELGGDLLMRTLAGLEAGRIEPRAQDDARATHAPPLKKEDGLLDWTAAAGSLERRVRAFTPEPGAFTFLAGRRLLVRRARALPPEQSGLPAGEPPGTLGPPLRSLGVAVSCGEGTAILLERVQLAGKKEIGAEAAVRGRQLPAGAVLGAPGPR